jgi:putative CocE/NonD family hydrolase
MDDHSLVYDSEPLTEQIEILGRPIARLNVSADATRANWVVRISDVAPDGQVTQVGGAAFNGTHRNSAREPEDIVANEVFPLEIQLHFTSWVFPEGHKIRIAISNSMWPMLWPTHTPFASTLQIGGETGARIELPVVPAGEERAPAWLRNPGRRQHHRLCRHHRDQNRSRNRRSLWIGDQLRRHPIPLGH